MSRDPEVSAGPGTVDRRGTFGYLLERSIKIAEPVTDTRERIIMAAMQLFWEKGYASTSIADILKAADANSGSLYHFFPGKQDVLLAVLDAYLAGIDEMLLRPLWEGVADPIDRVFALLGGYRRLLTTTDCQYGCPIGYLALELHEPDPPVRERIAANFSQWVDRVETCLEQAGDGLPADLDRRALAHFVLTTMEGRSCRPDLPVRDLRPVIAQLGPTRSRRARLQPRPHREAPAARREGGDADGRELDGGRGRGRSGVRAGRPAPPALFGRPGSGLTPSAPRPHDMARVFGVSCLGAGRRRLLRPPRRAGAVHRRRLRRRLCWVAGSFGINYQFEQKPWTLLLINGGYHTAHALRLILRLWHEGGPVAADPPSAETQAANIERKTGRTLGGCVRRLPGAARPGTADRAWLMDHGLGHATPTLGMSPAPPADGAGRAPTGVPC